MVRNRSQEKFNEDKKADDEQCCEYHAKSLEMCKERYH